MPRRYCTYLNVQYLGRGLALHASMLEHAGDFRLTAVCFDDISHRILNSMDLPNLEAIHLSELEAADPELLAVRSSRSAVEYLWTSTPCVIRFLIERDGLDEITYLDADTCLFSSPEPFFEELGDGAVLLTPASSSPQHYSLHLARAVGLYVVQFLTFRADDRGMRALEWWRERCIEWCEARSDQGRFGDQKYLDDWTERFEGVRNLAHPGMLGPWNIESREVACGSDGITVDGQPLVLYHYMGLRIYADGCSKPAAGRFRISAEQHRWIYQPYLDRVRALRARAAAVDPAYSEALESREPLRWRVQAPVSALIGALARARVRVAPHYNIGPYVPGGYVPAGYEANPAAISLVTESLPSAEPESVGAAQAH